MTRIYLTNTFVSLAPAIYQARPSYRKENKYVQTRHAAVTSEPI